MKKEYLILGAIGIVGVYFLMKKKNKSETQLEGYEKDRKSMGIKPFNLSDTKTGKGNVAGTPFDCRNAKLKYPEKYEDAVREYEFLVQVKTNSGALTGVSPMMREQEICKNLHRNIMIPNINNVGMK